MKNRYFYLIFFILIIIHTAQGENDAIRGGLQSQAAITQARQAARRAAQRAQYYGERIQHFEAQQTNAENRITELRAQIATAPREANTASYTTQLQRAEQSRDEAMKALDTADPNHGTDLGNGLGRDIGPTKGLRKKMEEAECAVYESQQIAEDLQNAHNNVNTAQRTLENAQKDATNASDDYRAASSDQMSDGETSNARAQQALAANESAQRALTDAQNNLNTAQRDLANLATNFNGSQSGTSVTETTPPTTSSSPPSTGPLNTQSLIGGGNSLLETINAVNEGRAAAGPVLQQQMTEMQTRANDQSLSGPITGRSNAGYQSNDGQAYINGLPVQGRYFDDVYGGGRYFVPNSEYDGRGLDGYMANRTTDLRGLHQLNGTIASGNATRVGSNIQFDGFYNGEQAYRNGMWNAPANGSQASRTDIPFSPSNSMASVQVSPRFPTNNSPAQTQTPSGGFLNWFGQFFGRIWRGGN